MITSFEVGAIFKIVNEASPALTKILRQVRELSAAIDKARENLATVGKFAMPTGLTAAVAETSDLAKAWGDVAKNATTARFAIGNASTVAARAALPSAAAAATGGGGGRHRPGWLGRGGAHISGPAMGLPGGGHIRVGGRLGGGAMAAAGMLGYGAYQAAEMEDAVWQLIYHSGGEQNDATRSKFRKILQDSMSESGYSLHDISESAKQEIRMFQGTPGGGIDVLPEMLRAATIESRLKGESREESMKALIGLAHMTKQYDPAAIRKLAPAFAFLSTANPGSLSSIERAAGYAVPLLQSGLEIDPMQSLLLGTALTRAGATSTKSGTWLREMALRAMPGTSMMSKLAFRKHEEALKAVGLVDDKDKPTWFTDGKPDLLKMLDIAGANAQKIPVEKRAAIERGLFGAQGGGGFALLADPAVREQILSLQKTMNSPEFKNRYSGFVDAYQQGSTVQQARTAMADFNITMMDIGRDVLPAVNVALHNFKDILEGVRHLLPGGDGKSMATVGARAGEGALAGAAWGMLGGPLGVAGGAAAGAVVGGTLGVAETYMKNLETPVDRFGREVVITGNSAAQAAEGMKALGDAIRGLHGGGSVFPGGTSAAPMSLSLNIDGRKLAEAVSSGSSPFVTQAPAFDGSGMYAGGDHQHTDK
jgi:hypothetical protein